MNSDEDNYYLSSGDDSDGMEAAEESGDDNDMLEAAEGNDPDSDTRKDYIILQPDRIRDLQENDISEVTEVLSVSRGIACTLLLRHNWCPTSVVIDKWLSGDEVVCEIIATWEKSKCRKGEMCCRICLEIFEIKSMLSVRCGHLFCEGCWKDYLSASINDGPGCLNMLCPEHKCEAVAGLDMVEAVACDDDRNKYYSYLRRSYIECSKKKKKWCPGPGCEFAVQFDSGECETYDVRCDCGHKFCWNCREEWHRPVDCATVLKWIEKNSSEEDNVSWIAVYTKPCPKCKQPIEKNQGCNHMKCRAPCGYNFCWLCLQPWKDSCYCNKYHDNLPNEKEEKRMQDTKRELERYAHYYERWASNNRSRKIALADMDRAENVLIPMFSDLGKVPETSLRFVMEAWEQIVECRGVLKWTYAYGYYMDRRMLKKKTFFEYLQGQAEASLERLHHCAEVEMKTLIKLECSSKEFQDYRPKLIDLTVVTGKYFQKLVKALENNLYEVEYVGTSDGQL